MKDVIEIIENIRVAESKDELSGIVEELSSLIGLEYYLLGYTKAESMISSETTIIDNYPSDWRAIYDNENLVQHDPTVEYSLSRSAPITWHQIGELPLRNSQKDVMSQAKDSGLKTGFSIPLHGAQSEFGMFSFGSSSSDHSMLNSAIVKAQVVAPVLLDKLKNFNAPIDISLTKREKECLLWVSEGKSSWEISVIIGCSERTVVFHLTNATNKLGCTNRYQAVSKAIILGIIRPMI
ncbi:LuxR family transcriptional regulator [Enterovibrio sp. ZSDZ35]|uniref:LuxR family transcriptional regulator n=1 Tax=Enterovibrio qingdaonensis TaxID=2899818 RepID=A0ABT5QQY3_9GAMM|nr:LuxR family transcriptional regulator [Enterovibrio sp. ZSDZ35]MDD1782999.1 LuxR family transcriptional regulator [Enterovibrio sp. ZSDZ35]